RLTDESDIGDELELQLQIARDTVLTRLELERRLMRRRGEVRISLPTAAAFSDANLLTVLYDFAEELSGIDIPNDRSRWNRHDDVRARFATLVASRSVVAILGLPRIAVGVVEQRREVVVA